jgi:hypothetical protein
VKSLTVTGKDLEELEKEIDFMQGMYKTRKMEYLN